MICIQWRRANKWVELQFPSLEEEWGGEITTFYFEHFDSVENSLMCYPSFLKTCNKHPTLEKFQGKVSKLLVAARPSGD